MADFTLPTEIAGFNMVELARQFPARQFRHRADDGDVRDTVVIEIPEAEHRLQRAIAETLARSARLLIVCDTIEQAERIGALVLATLREYHEVCAASPFGESWICALCGLSWALNDPSPPACPVMTRSA